jgi:hypothetical protein
VNGIETEGCVSLRDEPGGDLPTAQAVPGMEVARARLRLWCGTWEPVAPMPTASCRRKEGPQEAATSRGRVPTGGTGADRLVVAMRPGNAGGAKEAGHLGSFGGQPQRRGRSR